MRRALALSLAMAGDHAGAFAAAADAAGVLRDLWVRAATGSDDATFLRAAIGTAGSAGPGAPPGTDVATVLAVAGRLVDLGFPEQALRWLGPPRGTTEPEARRLAARASLAAGDAQGALEPIAGMGDAASESLRAEAYTRLGNNLGAAEAYGRASRSDAREIALRLAEAWADTDLAAPTLWSAAASIVVGGPGSAGVDSTAPALARMHTLAGSSEQAREAALALLDSLRGAP